MLTSHLGAVLVGSAAYSTRAADAWQRPFIFISAAEAKWTFDGVFRGTPVGWLHEYLIAKRAAEDEVGLW